MQNLGRFEEENSWNKKRVLILIGIFMAIIFGGLIYLNDNSSHKTSSAVEGISTKREDDNFNKMSSEISGQIKDRTLSVKDEVNTLDVKEVATSSPQIQKIINDIKSLENYPNNQAKDICSKICGGL